MDQILPLPPTVTACRSADCNSAALAVPGDEDPESPGRSPGASSVPSSDSDPLSDGFALLTGVTIALIAVAVPLITVICEPRPVEPLRTAARVAP